jgi:hypothetical protein
MEDHFVKPVITQRTKEEHLMSVHSLIVINQCAQSIYLLYFSYVNNRTIISCYFVSHTFQLRLILLSAVILLIDCILEIVDGEICCS